MRVSQRTPPLLSTSEVSAATPLVLFLLAPLRSELHMATSISDSSGFQQCRRFERSRWEEKRLVFSYSSSLLQSYPLYYPSSLLCLCDPLWATTFPLGLVLQMVVATLGELLSYNNFVIENVIASWFICLHVYMASIFYNQYKLLARSGNKVQEKTLFGAIFVKVVAPKPATEPNPAQEERRSKRRHESNDATEAQSG
ncbi:hypothetical protein PIB30_104228, partial [Stylosanthes scabra]|nr:hypothetical protein [Stylosanthes scabra]